MKSNVKKIIEKELERYKQKDVKISDKQYTLYIVPELCDEDLNIFEGILFVEADNKSEVSYLKTRYKPPVSGYAPRIGIILYDNHLLLKDYRKNKHIIKTLKKINKTFLNKLKKALSEPKEENLSKLFDRSDVIEEFYILYKKAREHLLKNIKGIPEEEKREEFVDNFMMQMLTLWYLQERGFFNNDKNYFITKFKESKQKKLFGEFKNYYEFLSYFFEKLSDNLDSQYYEDKIVGKVVVIGPAVFLNGEYSKAISIPDKCFYKEGMTDVLINTPPKKVSQEVPLLNLFESRDWTEGNIDEFVLGAIYEKLITYMERKKLGAYYTPEEITSYICKNTIEPYLVDRVNEKFKRNFETIDQIIESNDKDILFCLFEQLKEIKILDPAVGSAHFLESAINVLVSIYEKIREKAIELGIKKGLEIIAADEKGEIKTINLLEISDDDEFKLLIKFFIILSKNIYGVDINPSALKVAKARLFLTLAKHFKVGKEKDIFIRFPNVHFNLREGNSLIGYVDIERQKPKGQLQLDLFVNEEQAEYIVEKIKVVSELKPHLEKTANALEISGNVVNEVKDLNRILLKEQISWHDFEKVLRTKEKLIRILIASLNSQYAEPLNKLLSLITDLFKHKLDEKFAEEHEIKLEDLKKIKTFHWIFEFPEVFLDRGGFDVVVGNPPYGGNIHQIEKELANQKCNIAKGNIAKAFVLRSYDLTKRKSYVSLLSPKSLTYASDWYNLRKYIIGELLEIYDIKEAFKDVRLEQIFYIIKRESKEKYYLAKDFFSKDQPIKIEKEKIEDTLLCDLSAKDYEIIARIEKKFSLGEIIWTWRGLPLQQYLDNTEGEEVISGKNIALYSIKNNLPKVKIENLLTTYEIQIKELKKAKLVFQNIVAFISKPVPHIRVMGTWDDVGRLTLDTVNNIKVKKQSISPFFILGLMNSLFFNWLLHRIAFNKAVRTMHLDNYALNKVPIPPLSEDIMNNIEKLVRTILVEGFSIDKYFAIEDEILRLYGIRTDDYPQDYATIREHYRRLWGRQNG